MPDPPEPGQPQLQSITANPAFGTAWTLDPASILSAYTYNTPQPPTQSRQIFVGYPYRIPADDYRPIFEAVGDEFDVAFIFADAELTNKHILDKVAGMMTRADFSLFDITYWNPNVALELGLAYGRRLDFYILFDPTKENPEVLSDLRGIDRIEYRTYAQLREALAGLIRDQYGAPEQEQSSTVAAALVEQIEGLRAGVPELLRANPGQQIGGIASSLGVPIELAQTIVRPLVGGDLETRGVRRGVRYYVAGTAPPEEEDAAEAEPSDGDESPQDATASQRRS